MHSVQENKKLRKELEAFTRQEMEQLEAARAKWEMEKSSLIFLLEERDKALSEAREGQAAATSEMEQLSEELTHTRERLSLLEEEAIKKGIPLVKVGDTPVVGQKGG